VLRRACFNMADDEEAVVLACKKDIMFYYYLLFQLTNEIKFHSKHKITNCKRLFLNVLRVFLFSLHTQFLFVDVK